MHMLKWSCSQMFHPKPVAEQPQSKVNEVKTSELPSGSDDVKSSDATGEEATYGLSVLAEAALNVLDDY